MSLLLKLLWSFLQIGLFSIGGGYATIPLIQQQVVELHHWLSLQEFTDIITISQMTPGPLAVNTSTFVGVRIAGLPGALIATFGCIISGFTISLLLYRIFQKRRGAGGAADVLRGLKAASVGLIAASASTMLLLALCGTAAPEAASLQLNWTAAAVFAAALLLLRKFKWNPMVLLALSGAVGAIIYTH